MEGRYPKRERRPRITSEEADQIMRDRIAAIQDRIVPEQEVQELMNRYRGRYHISGRPIYEEPDTVPEPLPQPSPPLQPIPPPLPPSNPIPLPQPQRIHFVRSFNPVPFSEQLPPPKNPRPKRKAKAKARPRPRRKGDANLPIIVSESDDDEDVAVAPIRELPKLELPARHQYYLEDFWEEPVRASGCIDVGSVAPPPFFVDEDIKQLLSKTNRMPVSVSGANHFCFLRACVLATAGTYNLDMPLMKQILNIEGYNSLDEYEGIHINTERGHSGDRILANALLAPVATVYYQDDDVQRGRVRIKSVSLTFPFDSAVFAIYVKENYSDKDTNGAKLTDAAKAFLVAHLPTGNENLLLELFRNKRIVFLMMHTDARGIGNHFDALVGGMMNGPDPRDFFRREFQPRPLPTFPFPPTPPIPYTLPSSPSGTPSLPPLPSFSTPLPTAPIPYTLPSSPSSTPSLHPLPRLPIPSPTAPPTSSSFGSTPTTTTSPPPLGTESPSFTFPPSRDLYAPSSSPFTDPFPSPSNQFPNL